MALTHGGDNEKVGLVARLALLPRMPLYKRYIASAFNVSCIVELINASTLDHVQPITPVDTSLVDRRLRCQLINLAHIRHDRIPAVRASGGPLYQKSRRKSPDRLSWRRSRNNMAVWLRETSFDIIKSTSEMSSVFLHDIMHWAYTHHYIYI